MVEQHLHLEILSTIARTIQQTSSGRSSFFAFNRFGTRFGCTHPLTALRLYQAISLYPACCMVHHCGTSSTLKWKCTYERYIGRSCGQFKDSTTRCPKVGELWMAGTKNIKDIVLKEKFTFLHSILQLPDQAAPRQVLLACLSSSSPRSWINTIHHLDTLNLPDISTLAANTPSAGIWHRCVDRLIACQSQLNLLEEAESKREKITHSAVFFTSQPGQTSG